MREALLGGTSSPPSDQDIEQAVEEVFEARACLENALTEKIGAARPSENARESASKANILRNAMAIVLQKAQSLAPAPKGASGAGGGGENPGREPTAPAELVSGAIKDGLSVLRYLDGLANEFETNPYGVPNEFLIFGPSTFHQTPAQLRQGFVAWLLIIWSRVTGQAIRDLKIGSVEHQRGLLDFLAAAVMPLTEKDEPDLIPLATMRTHALKLRGDAKKYGEEIVEIARFVVPKTTI